MAFPAETCRACLAFASTQTPLKTTAPSLLLHFPHKLELICPRPLLSSSMSSRSFFSPSSSSSKSLWALLHQRPLKTFCLCGQETILLVVLRLYRPPDPPGFHRPPSFSSFLSSWSFTSSSFSLSFSSSLFISGAAQNYCTRLHFPHKLKLISPSTQNLSSFATLLPFSDLFGPFHLVLTRSAL